MYKFEVWYESYPVITRGNASCIYTPGRTLCAKTIEVLDIANFHNELNKGLQEEGFSNCIMFYRKLNKDGSIDEEFEKVQRDKLYEKFPSLKDIKLDMQSLNKLPQIFNKN